MSSLKIVVIGDIARTSSCHLLANLFHFKFQLVAYSEKFFQNCPDCNKTRVSYNDDFLSSLCIIF